MFPYSTWIATMPTWQKKVIIDVDPGIDDAIALAIALFDPRLEVLAVTATGGNVLFRTSPQTTYKQLLRISIRLEPHGLALR